MGTYRIVGGVPLRGVVPIHGAKNSVLPILAATLAARGCCVLHNCPHISDVDTALDILHCLGCDTERRGDTLIVDTASADTARVPAHLMRKMRAAVLFLGALLTRFGAAELYLPGGCALGVRPIDLHLRGLRHLGAEIEQEGDALLCRASALSGGTIALPYPSVGATENLLLAALSASDEVIICNAAREPEIADLIAFLRVCGADIRGEGSSVICVRGGRTLHGAEFTVMPDRMEAATYLAAAAATRGSITLQNTHPPHYAAVTEVFRRVGCRIDADERELTLQADTLHAVSPIRTAPYDGFPTDALAPIMAVMTVAEGISIFEETVFSDRFLHIPALCAMGAEIRAASHCAVVRGVKRLHGAQVEATDLRGGAAMVIAALAADGESRIAGTEHLRRGYSSFAAILRSCGAQMQYEEG